MLVELNPTSVITRNNVRETKKDKHTMFFHSINCQIQKILNDCTWKLQRYTFFNNWFPKSESENGFKNKANYCYIKHFILKINIYCAHLITDLAFKY